MARQKPILAIVGLGYVGLPLAAAFSRAGYKVIGFDTSQNRIQELQSGIDTTQELSPKEVQSLTDIDFTAQETALQNAVIYIITVPTPIDRHKKARFNSFIDRFPNSGNLSSKEQSGDL